MEDLDAFIRGYGYPAHLCRGGKQFVLIPAESVLLAVGTRWRDRPPEAWAAVTLALLGAVRDDFIGTRSGRP
jgi:hypothetical protein